MANSATNQPGSETTNVQEVEDINPMDNITASFEKNQKTIITAVVVLVVAVVGYFGYENLYKKPAEEDASKALTMPSIYYQVDSLNMALNGDGKNPGFSKIEKKYSGTAAANLAYYYEGLTYLKMGDYKKAISALSKFDGKGTLLENQANGAIGVAYMESGDKNKAIDYFKKATANKEDDIVTPLYLYHLGLAYEAAGQNNEAKDVFIRIRDEYPRSIHARDMEKELAKLGVTTD